VFSSMFRNGMMEEQTGEARILDFSRNSFRAFLEFVYLGKDTSRILFMLWKRAKQEPRTCL
jgi:hypothetical protein